MPRIRTVKPDFFTSADIVALSPMARLLYIATWCEADKEGRLVWKPRTFKLRYLPGDDCDVGALCDELTASGLVILYGDGFAYIPSFAAHQHINPRETESQLPAPDASSTCKSRVGTRKPRVGTRQARDSDAQGGREGKGKEGSDDASRPDAFAVFWKAFPNRKAKQDAAKAWTKLAPDAKLQASILEAIADQSKCEEWCKEGGRFVPHAATWLNGRRWEDEPGALGAVVQNLFAGAR